MTQLKPSLLLDFANDRQLGPLVAFTRASTATRFNSSGLIETVQSNQPRFDFDPVTLACRGLLIEEARTNLFLNRQTSATGLVITLDAGPARGPDGSLAFTMIPNAGSVSFPSRTGVGTSLSAAVGVTTDYAFRGYFAPVGTGAYVATLAFDANISGASNLFATVNFNPTTGLFIQKFLGTGWSDVIAPTAVMNNQGMWEVMWVVRFTQQATTRNTVSFGTQVRGPANEGSYTADGTTGIAMSCCQFEIGSFPTSYIPTTITSVTRAIEGAVLLSGANFNSCINPNVGTFIVEYNNTKPDIQPNFRSLVSLNDATANNRVTFGVNALNSQIRTLRNTANAGLIQTPVTTNTCVQGRNRAIITYAQGNISIVLNSGTVVSAAHAIAPLVNQIEIGRQLGAAFINDSITSIQYYPFALSNNDLQILSRL